MQFDMKSILFAMRATVAEPRKGARAVMALQLPLSVGAMALALMVLLSSILSVIAARLFLTEADQGIAVLLNNPFQMVVTQGVILAITVMLITGVGRRFGGTGTLAQAVVLIAWLEAILNLLQLAQIVLMVLSLALADIVGFLSILLFLWLLANFVAELHGFKSAAKVLVMIMVTGFFLSFVMVLLGVMLFGLGGANV